MTAPDPDRGYITWRPTKRIAAKLEAIQDVLVTYQDHLPMTVRQIFYVLVAQLVIEKTALEYRNLASAPSWRLTTRHRRRGGISTSASCTTSARGSQPPPQVEPPPARFLVSEEGLCNWVANARPGHRVEYFRGLLAHDRMPSAKALPEHERLALVALAKRVMQLAEDGRVLAVQRRHGDGCYSYLAIKTRHRRAGRRGNVGLVGELPCRR